MRRLFLFVVSVLLCSLYTTVYADIYTWIDKNGVKHFTNFAPPANAEVIMKTEELPYDEQADQERMAAERQERLVAAWQELADKEAELLDRQRAAEQRIEAANVRAEEALSEAEALLNEAEERYNRDSNRGYVHYGYYPYYGHYKRWYYRKNGSLYYKYPYYKHRQKHKYKHKRRPHPTRYDGYPKQRQLKRHGDLHHNQRSHVNHRLSLKRHRPRSHASGHRFNGRSARFGRIR
jgi:Skp family chaperone for outer membrane proteins